MVCLPWAGGSASAFRTWQLDPALAVEVWGVQWPGHETRWREPTANSVAELVEGLEQALQPLLDRPLVLFGHSMGALAAYELTRRLEAAGQAPELLVLSSHRAAHRPPSRPPASDLPLPELLARLDRMSGPSQSVIRDTGLLTVLAPVLRADFALCERYRHRPGPRLRVPVLALAATDDPEVGVDEVTAWAELTDQDTRLALFEGGHLFLLDHAGEVLRQVTRALAGPVPSASGEQR